MPLSSAASSRTRKVRDKDKDNRHSSATARRPKEHSRASTDRVSPPQPQTSQLSLYAHQNVTLDQLPPLPSSGATSPSSSTSPVLRTKQLYPKYTETTRLPHHFHTPASLRPYLQDDDEVDDSTDPAESESQETENPSVTTGTTAQHALDPPSSPENEPQPEILGQALYDLTSSCPTLPTVNRQNVLISSPQTSLNTHITPHNRPDVTYNQAQHPLSPQLPTSSAYASDHFFAPRYSVPHHFAMIQSSSRAGELHQMPPHPMPYFTGYGYPNRPLIPFGAAGNVMYQGQSQGGSNQRFLASSRMAKDADIGPGGNFSNFSEGEDGTAELLHRIQSAIPDLHLLVERFRETSSQLGIKESLIRQSEVQTRETLRQKETYIDRLVKEMELESQRYSAETSKLRLEIGNLEEKHRELHDSVIAVEKSRAELGATYDAWKAQAEHDYLVKAQSFEEDAVAQVKVEAAVENKVSAMSIVHLSEVHSLEAKWQEERQELEASHTRTKRELEAALQACRSELEDAMQRERETHESWEREREALRNNLQEQRETVAKEWEEERQSLLKYQKGIVDNENRDRRLSQQCGYGQVEEENERLRKQIQGLKMGWEADKIKFNRVTGELKAVAAKLDSENGRLQKMVEAFGEATDFKSRGDTFFIDAFSQLRNNITGLANEYCKGALTEVLPNYILSKMPVNLPDFTAATPASVSIRASYVQHIISSILTTRIFQPFLFTLSRRHETANRLFDDMSQQLRQKSTRREASWRQHTLHAAYTARSAKQAVNKVAVDIVKDICGELKYLIQQDEGEHVHTAVRRIVKIAAETWRYARLEREVIIASMSTEEFPNMFDAEHFLPRGKDTHVHSSEHILPILPFIERESKQDDGRSSKNKEVISRIYSRGVALYTNSPPVLTRRAELQQSLRQHTGSIDRTKGEPAEKSQEREGECLHKSRDVTIRPSSPVKRDGPLSPSNPTEADAPNHLQGQRNLDMKDDGQAIYVEKASKAQETHSRTTLSRSSASSLNNGQSLSTATSPTEAIPDWTGSSGIIPPILDTW